MDDVNPQPTAQPPSQGQGSQGAAAPGLGLPPLRQAQTRQTEERILALRKEGRAWWIRGVLALVFGGLLGLLVPLMFAAGIVAFIV